MNPRAWVKMASKFEQLKNLVEAKIGHFPVSDRRVIVACSGGVDSTALFWVFLELFQAKKIFSLRLFHFNFGLRGDESDGDEAFCRGLAEGAGIPFELACASPEDRESRSGEGIQEWARRLRREALLKVTERAEWIVLAHHADDAAETSLMRIMRGASLANIRGMDEWSEAGHPPDQRKFFRPWLAVPKEDIVAAAAERSMLFREDTSNAKLDYARNVIRHRVLPELLRLWPAGREKLADLACDGAELSGYALAHAIAETACQSSAKEMKCSRQKLCALPDSIALAVLAHMVQRASSGSPRQLSRANLRRCLESARSPAEVADGLDPADSGKKFTLEMSRGIFLEVRGDTVRSFPGPA